MVEGLNATLPPLHRRPAVALTLPRVPRWAAVRVRGGSSSGAGGEWSSYVADGASVDENGGGGAGSGGAAGEGYLGYGGFGGGDFASDGEGYGGFGFGDDDGVFGGGAYEIAENEVGFGGGGGEGDVCGG